MTRPGAVAPGRVCRLGLANRNRSQTSASVLCGIILAFTAAQHVIGWFHAAQQDNYDPYTDRATLDGSNNLFKSKYASLALYDVMIVCASSNFYWNALTTDWVMNTAPLANFIRGSFNPVKPPSFPLCPSAFGGGSAGCPNCTCPHANERYSLAGDGSGVHVGNGLVLTAGHVINPSFACAGNLPAYAVFDFDATGAGSSVRIANDRVWCYQGSLWEFEQSSEDYALAQFGSCPNRAAVNPRDGLLLLADGSPNPNAPNIGWVANPAGYDDVRLVAVSHPSLVRMMWSVGSVDPTAIGSKTFRALVAARTGSSGGPLYAVYSRGGTIMETRYVGVVIGTQSTEFWYDSQASPQCLYELNDGDSFHNGFANFMNVNWFYRYFCGIIQPTIRIQNMQPLPPGRISLSVKTSDRGLCQAPYVMSTGGCISDDRGFRLAYTRPNAAMNGWECSLALDKRESAAVYALRSVNFYATAVCAYPLRLMPPPSVTACTNEDNERLTPRRVHALAMSVASTHALQRTPEVIERLVNETLGSGYNLRNLVWLLSPTAATFVSPGNGGGGWRDFTEAWCTQNGLGLAVGCDTYNLGAGSWSWHIASAGWEPRSGTSNGIANSECITKADYPMDPAWLRNRQTQICGNVWTSDGSTSWASQFVTTQEVTAAGERDVEAACDGGWFVIGGGCYVGLCNDDWETPKPNALGIIGLADSWTPNQVQPRITQSSPLSTGTYSAWRCRIDADDPVPHDGIWNIGRRPCWKVTARVTCIRRAPFAVPSSNARV